MVFHHSDFEESLKDVIKSTCRVCKKELITNREHCGKLIPRKICDLCNKKENQERVIKATSQFKFLIRNDINFRNKMKEAWKRGGKRTSERIAKYGLSPKWIAWYKNFGTFGKSKIEDKVVDFLKNKVSKILNVFSIAWGGNNIIKRIYDKL